MTDICPVCDKKINMFSLDTIQGVDIHDTCRESFYKNPEKYGAITGDEEREETAEHRRKKQEEKSVYKSVYIKGGIDVKSFDMPFGDMVMFMVKWAIASIPAFIILAIIGAILTGIFGSLFF